MAILVLQIAVIAAPGFEPDADAQTICTAGSGVQLNSCISTYNSSATPVTIRLIADIVMGGQVTIINSPAAVPPKLTVDGQGHTLDGNTIAQDLIEQDAGDTLVTNITLTGATSSGAQADAGAFTVTNTTMTDNAGNGLYANSSIETVVSNSTFANNTGSGIEVDTLLEVRSSTNSSNAFAGITGIGTARVGGSLIADNGTADCGGALLFTDLTGNAIEDNSCNGTATAGLAFSFSSTLDDNGCTVPCTQTIALLPGSPAIDANTTCAAGLVDQLGAARTANQCDAGAVEAGDCNASATVSTEVELGFAIGCYNSASVATTILLNNDIVLTAGLPDIANFALPPQLTLDGQGHVLDGGGPVLDLLYLVAGDVLVTNVTLTRGLSSGIEANGGSLTITNSTLTNNGSNGIFANSPIETVVTNSTISNNGGTGILTDTSVEVRSSTIANNNLRGFDTNGGGAVRAEGSLIAGNTPGDCSGGLAFTDLLGNVIGDNTCTGIATAGLAGTYDALLADNGCTAPCTQTIALVAGSPAIDADTACAAGFDQRGMPRLANACDAGAFELAVVSTATCHGLAVTIDLNLGATGIGTAGDDVIFGTPGNDVIDGLGGDDTICGEDGNDTINGGPGLDFIFGGQGNDTLAGGDGNDRIRGQQGIDNIGGNDGNDFLYGGIEGDTVNGGNGNDVMGGFGGDDAINGGPGNDTIFGGFGADIITGGMDNDRILGLAGDDTITGGPGDDELNGDKGQDTINGSAGNDVIKGGNSIDTLFGDAGDDIVSGGKGDDALSGGTGVDTCTGNTENIADTADATCETTFGVP